VTTFAPSTDRTLLWLPLLRRLTELCPNWVVWKNAESAFNGVGDIDAAADITEWPVIEREFRDWARQHGLGPVIVCHHIPGGLDLCAVPPHFDTLLEIGVKARKVWRGSTLFELDGLRPLFEIDPLGFRRIRRGAEGVFKLLLNGSRWNGCPNAEGLCTKRVRELLRSDPEGVRMAARLFGPARSAVIAGATAAAAGNWDRAAIIRIQTWALLKSLTQPTVLLRRAWFRASAKKLCPVVWALLQQHRTIPADRERWLSEVATGHVIYR
jgi:hypothetical protein